MLEAKEAGEQAVEKYILDDLEKELEHGILVSNLAAMTARELGECEEYCKEMAVAGFVHDIGKLKLSRYLYGRKKDSLTIDELNYFRQHSRIGYEIVRREGYSVTVQNAVLYHHENYDGSGYPDNLMADMIPLGARLIHICDSFSALTADRLYRGAFSTDIAMEIMIDEIKNFDMRIFLAFQRVINEETFEKMIQESRQDKIKVS